MERQSGRRQREVESGSGAFDGPYSFKSRFEEGHSPTNPEELIGAAHAGCFTMALTAQLSRAGITPTRIHYQREGERSAKGSITTIELETEEKKRRGKKREVVD